MPRHQLQEFKPRKAKFGFKIDEFLLEHIVPVAEVLTFLKTFPSTSYTIEYGMPYKGRSIIFKLYTDDDMIADTVRDKFMPVTAKGNSDDSTNGKPKSPCG